MQPEVKEQGLVINPDGSIAFAVPWKPPQKARIICWSCKKVLEFEKGAMTVKCGSCSKLNAVTGGQDQQQFVLFRCNSCQTILRAPKNVNLVNCAKCNTISILDAAAFNNHGDRTNFGMHFQFY